MRASAARARWATVLVVALALGGCSGGAPGSVTPATRSPSFTAAPRDATASTAEPSTDVAAPTPAPSTPVPSTTEEPPAATPTTGPPTTTAPSSPSGPAPTSPTTPPSAQLVEAWGGQDIEAFDTDRDVVALTFDGGASDTAVDAILETLQEEGVPATFFVTGAFARAHPDSVRAMADAGHPVGNHSDTHPHFPESTNQEIRAELAAAESAIATLTGTSTAPLFRFPFGDRTPLDITVVNDAGYIPVRWTVDSLGWQGTSGGITTTTVRERVLATLRPGQVVLLHVGAHPTDGSTLDADALPGIIADLKARGYGFVTVPELLAEGP